MPIYTDDHSVCDSCGLVTESGFLVATTYLCETCWDMEYGAEQEEAHAE